MSKMKYSYTVAECDEYPDDCTISVEFDGEATLTQAVTAFKMFLKGCEYCEDRVESLEFYQDGDLWNK